MFTLNKHNLNICNSTYVLSSPIAQLPPHIQCRVWDLAWLSVLVNHGSGVEAKHSEVGMRLINDKQTGGTPAYPRHNTRLPWRNQAQMCPAWLSPGGSSDSRGSRTGGFTSSSWHTAGPRRAESLGPLTPWPSGTRLSGMRGGLSLRSTFHFLPL